MSSKTIIFSTRTGLSIVAIAIVLSVVAASVLSNYVLPSRVSITTFPGIHASFCDSGTQAILTPATTFDWGDIQQGQSKTALFVSIANDQGNLPQWLISNGQAVNDTGGGVESLRIQGPPSGTTLSWNMPSVTGSPLQLQPGQRTQCISVTLSVSTSATGGVFNFGIVFATYPTSTG